MSLTFNWDACGRILEDGDRVELWDPDNDAGEYVWGIIPKVSSVRSEVVLTDGRRVTVNNYYLLSELSKFPGRRLQPASASTG